MATPDAVSSLERDLRDIFGNRMQTLVVYGTRRATPGMHTLVVVDVVSAEDLRACGARIASWQDAGLETPLVLDTHEFERSLDAFPLEFGAILDDHHVVAGRDLFRGLQVRADDARRACEVQARSHLLHLREGFIETQGRSDALADLIVRSSGPIAALIANVARLDAIHPVEGVLSQVAALGDGPLTSDAARALFPEYLAAMTRLTAAIDGWSHS